MESCPSNNSLTSTNDSTFSNTNLFEKFDVSPEKIIPILKSSQEMNDLNDEPIHILFVIHGIGSNQANLLDNESRLNESLNKVKGFRKNMFPKKVEIKMLDWKSFLVEEKFHKIEEITLKNHDSKRHLMNTIPADILFYLSKSHSKKILIQIVKQANAIASQYSNCKNVKFSFLAHSLGSVIAYDLLEKNHILKTEKTHKTSNKIRLAFEVDYLFNIGSPLSLFLTISHDHKIIPLDESNFVKGIFNIYHPHDLFAYRLEPALDSIKKVRKPIHIPFYKNDGYKKHKENAGSMLNIVCCPKTKSFIEENNLKNDKKRYDFELQESFLEYCIETLGLIESHTSYWKNLDCAYFILRQIHEMDY